MYYITETGEKGGDEFVLAKAETQEEAIGKARDWWAAMCKADQEANDIEIRVYIEDIEDEDCEIFDYNTIEWREEA